MMHKCRKTKQSNLTPDKLNFLSIWHARRLPYFGYLLRWCPYGCQWFLKRSAPMMGAFLTIPAHIMGTFLEILPPFRAKNNHFPSKWPNFCLFLHGFSKILHLWWVSFFVIHHGGLHIHSNFPSEYLWDSNCIITHLRHFIGNPRG